MLARQHDAAVEGAEIVVVLGAALIGPAPAQPKVQGTRCQATATPFWNSVLVLRMDLRAIFQRVLDRSSGDMRGELKASALREGIGAQQHALALVEEAVDWDSRSWRWAGWYR